MAGYDRAGVGVLAAAILVVTARLGVAPYDTRERPFVQAAAGIVASGDGATRPEIPPLLPWLQASCLRILGDRPASLRLPSAIATIGSILLVAWVARRRFGPEGSAWSAAILLATPIVFIGARLATPDALVAVHVLAIVALETGAHDDTGGPRAAVIGALLGLAFLAKGPLGVLVPLAVMLGGRTASGQALVPRPRNVGFAVAAWGAVALPWVLVLARRVGLWRFGAALRDGALGLSRPPWFHAVVLAVGLAPWTGPLVTGLFRTVVPGRGGETPTVRYAAGGILSGLLLLSLGRVADPMALLSLAPLASLIVTAEIGEELALPRRRRYGRGLVACALVATTVVAGVVSTRSGSLPRPFAVATTLTAGSGAVVALAAVVLERPRLAYAAAVVATVTTFLAAVIFLPVVP